MCLEFHVGPENGSIYNIFVWNKKLKATFSITGSARLLKIFWLDINGVPVGN